MCSNEVYAPYIFKSLGGGGVLWKKLYTSLSFALLHALSLLRRQLFRDYGNEAVRKIPVMRQQNFLP